MPENGSNDTLEAQAKAWAQQITWWENVDMQAQLGDQSVQIVQKASIAFRSGSPDRDVLKSSDGTVYLWAGDFGKEQKQDLLDEGLLILGNSCFVTSVDAFRPEYNFVWI